MEKISSILPSNARLKSVDLDQSAPVRPGVPAMGRNVGRSSTKDRFAVSQEAKDLAFQETLGGRNPKEAAHAKIADDMARKFFEQRVGSRAEERSVREDPEIIAPDVDAKEFTPASARQAPKGSYVDTLA